MIRLLAIALFALLTSCDSPSGEPTYNNNYKAAFDSILNTYDLNGSILIYQPQTKEYYSNNYEWAKKSFIPASTFKIANALIALETGVVKSDTTTFKWNGEKRSFSTWEKDLSFKEAFQLSCVPCFQEVARNIGLDNMKTYLNKMHYNGMDVTANNLDNFWLEGNSSITSFEQINFLERLLSKRLPILNTSRETMLRILKIEDNPNYKLSGKTGWSTQNNQDNGWFVGYMEKNNKIYYFALNVIPKDPTNLDKFTLGRKHAMLDAFKSMQII